MITVTPSMFSPLIQEVWIFSGVSLIVMWVQSDLWPSLIRTPHRCPETRGHNMHIELWAHYKVHMVWVFTHDLLLDEGRLWAGRWRICKNVLWGHRRCVDFEKCSVVTFWKIHVSSSEPSWDATMQRNAVSHRFVWCFCVSLLSLRSSALAFLLHPEPDPAWDPEAVCTTFLQSVQPYLCVQLNTHEFYKPLPQSHQRDHMWFELTETCGDLVSPQMKDQWSKEVRQVVFGLQKVFYPGWCFFLCWLDVAVDSLDWKRQSSGSTATQ